MNLKSIAVDAVTFIDCLIALEVKSSKVDGALGVKPVVSAVGSPRLKFVNIVSNLKLVLRSSPPKSNLKDVLTGIEACFYFYNLYFSASASLKASSLFLSASNYSRTLFLLASYYSASLLNLYFVSFYSLSNL